MNHRFFKRRIYLDYASLTPIDKKVLKEMKKYYGEDYTNPSALYLSAVKAKKALEDARKRVARIIHAHPDEIVFTSGGTEGNQLVINNDNKHIIISGIEHSSIIKNTNATHIPVDEKGLIDLKLLKESIRPDTTLISVMLVNNETGFIEPIQEIAKIIRDYRKAHNSNFPLLHTDACQAALHLPIFVEKLGIDLLTLDSNKVYGPRAVGALYIRRGVRGIERQGTENIPGIMGFVKAMEIVEERKQKESDRIDELKNFFLDELKKINSKININGDLGNSSPHILNVSIPNVDNEFLVLQLDASGVECSTRSACLRDEDESYVLKAMGVNSNNSIRFSFGKDTTKSQLLSVIKIMKKILLK